MNNTFIIVNKFNENYIVLFSGSEEDVDNCLPVYRELCDGNSEVYKVSAENLDLEAINKDRDYAKNTLENLCLKEASV